MESWEHRQPVLVPGGAQGAGLLPSLPNFFKPGTEADPALLPGGFWLLRSLPSIFKPVILATRLEIHKASGSVSDVLRFLSVCSYRPDQGKKRGAEIGRKGRVQNTIDHPEGLWGGRASYRVLQLLQIAWIAPLDEVYEWTRAAKIPVRMTLEEAEDDRKERLRIFQDSGSSNELLT